MGIYLNPDNANFKETLRGDIYVDKSMMISTLNTFMDKGNKYICVSRPRRFGKTVTSNMLCAYYSKGCDSRDIFSGMKLSSVPDYDKKLNQFNVIKIDMNGEYQTAENKADTLRRLIRKIKTEMISQFSNIAFETDDTLADMMLRVYTETKETFIILIDEYDIFVREKTDQTLFNEYLSFLNGLFKNDTLRPAVSLAYLTGILPVIRDRIQSKLNNFREYTILDAKELSEFVGFTAEEVQELCRHYHTDYAECRRWYDGYRQRGFEIYCPESVVQSVTSGFFDDYWGQTSTYKVVSDRINADFDGMKDDVIRLLAGESVDVNVTRYMNTMTDFHNKSDAFTYLIHTGYLAYNSEDRTCRIPNREIRLSWMNAVEDGSDYKETDRIIQNSRALLKETWAGNSDAVAKALDASHINVTSNRSYDNEDALQSAVYLAYIYALNEYTVVKEITAGKGSADVVYIPFKHGIPAMIVELKRNGSAESAIDQIRNKQYFTSLSNYRGNLLFVGISYDPETKTHTCRIEQFIK